jgi:hypothetical protein
MSLLYENDSHLQKLFLKFTHTIGGYCNIRFNDLGRLAAAPRVWLQPKVSMRAEDACSGKRAATLSVLFSVAALEPSPKLLPNN